MTVAPLEDAQRAARIATVGYDYAGRALDPVGACNLCGSAAAVELSRRDRYGFAAVLRVCPGCGLGFLSPRLSKPEYQAFYESVYRPLVSAYHGRRIDAETVQEDQRGYAAELTEFLRARLARPPATVMDVGGSTGVVAAAMRDAFGSAATVLDPAPDELAVAAEQGMETVVGLAEDYDPGGRTWDLVLLCQTIDHLLDVTATLAALRGMTAPAGHAFIDVLDVRFMMRRHGAIEEAVKIDHPFYLTRTTARAFFARAGFAVTAERMSDDGHWGFLLAAAEPGEPDWPALRAEAERFLEEAWALRARRR